MENVFLENYDTRLLSNKSHVLGISVHMISLDFSIVMIPLIVRPPKFKAV